MIRRLVSLRPFFSLNIGCLLAGLFLATLPVVGQPQEAAKTPASGELSGYRTVENAIATRQSLAGPGTAGLVGYLGVHVERDAEGKPRVAAIQPDSPAAKAGLKVGDWLLEVAGKAITSSESLRETLLSHAPGEEIALRIRRGDETRELKARLTALSRPMRLSSERTFIGLQLEESRGEGEGAAVARVVPDSPAANAGIRPGDVVLKINGENLTRASELSDVVASRRPGDVLTLTLRRGDKEEEIKVTLAADRGTAGGGRPGFGFGAGRPEAGAPMIPLWRKDVMRLAVILVEFDDIKHNDKIPLAEWEKLLFSKGEYRDKDNATGQPVFGSLNDFFHEQSYGAFRVEGKVFPWVQVSRKRGDYSQGSGTSNRSALPSEALDKLLDREGRDAVNDFEALFFIYAGDRVRTNPGAVYYPHVGSLLHRGSNRRWNYLLTYEGGERMLTLNGCVKEFALLLGLPNLAARTENPGSEGLGPWCLLSNVNTTGRPQHLSAWAKEQLGWIQPTVLDPTVRQKLILAPIEDSPKECFKVLARADGSEYFLLENRQKKGFDSDLPGAGLLIWRVVNNRPILEESHGIEGPAGPRVQLEHVPYPSPANTSFTPLTTPSSASVRGGGLPVYITEIRRLPDGRIAFHIGYEYQ
ncbi:MAG: PDZ domain-containing protein [Gemmatales bacterium]|nr:PDZ domain-containing protein [Gemmatales bacterium]MDW8387318.1 PDZ domain-containing protein [Gemmatales bacterium]